MCFDNTFSRFSNKLTFFEIITDDPDPNWEKLNQLEDIDEGQQDTKYEFKLETFKVRSSKVVFLLAKSNIRLAL